MRRVLILLLLFPCLVVLMGGGQPLHDPPPIEVPEELTIKQVLGSIRVALAKRGWSIESTKMPERDKPGEINSTHTKEYLSLTIRIAFDDKQVDIDYAASQKFSYKPKKKSIHPRANLWIKNIERDIRVALDEEWRATLRSP